jgi:hypothetical protein
MTALERADRRGRGELASIDIAAISGDEIAMSRGLVLSLLASVCATLVGCSTYTGVVRERSSYDLKCPQDQISVKEIGGSTYAAEGCGANMTYTCVQSDALTKTCWKEGSRPR